MSTQMLPTGRWRGAIAGWITALALFTSRPLFGSEGTNPIDAHTPPGLAGGPITGSFPLNGFESINLYSGNVSLSLPLLKIGGRGEAGYTMMLAMNSRHWRVATICPGSRGSTDCDSPGTHEVQLPQSWAQPGVHQVGYGPGAMQIRYEVRNPTFTTICSGPYVNGSVGPTKTMLKLSFTTPDGAEHRFVDTATGGVTYSVGCAGNTPVPANRGTEFKSTDGLGARFVSDAAIIDGIDANASYGSPSGELYLKNGTKYRIDQGNVTQIRDRNGNLVTLHYDLTSRVDKITDSLNREVTINYAIPKDGPTDPYGNAINTYDKISYTGFGGAGRAIEVHWSNLGSLLAKSQWSIQTLDQLFPTLNADPAPPAPPKDSFVRGALDDPFDPPHILDAVLLPNGDPYTGIGQYRFQYNPYGEIARIILPTKGRIEYDYTTGDPWPLPDGVYRPYLIDRRIFKRREFEDLNILSLPVRTKHFSYLHGANYETTYTTVYEQDASAIAVTQRTTVHSFNGEPARLCSHQEPCAEFEESLWSDGKEFQTDIYTPPPPNAPPETPGTLMRTVKQTWDILPNSFYPFSPRVVSRATTLQDGASLKSRQDYTYDELNNVVEVAEYDWSASPNASPLFRIRHTDYAAFAAYIKDRPSLVTVMDGGHNEVAKTRYFYDQTVLDARPGISGLQMMGGSRGNATRTEKWVEGSTWIATRAEYDVAGNVVRAYDGEGHLTQYFFDDNFGSPDGNARNGATHDGYGFPTRVVNAAGQTTYAQYDYNLGKPVDSEDVNGVVTSISYQDALDRLTAVSVRANGSLVDSGVIAYDDANLRVTQRADHATAGDLLTETQRVFDPFGQEIQSRACEAGVASCDSNSGNGFIITAKQYDALGRVAAASNPYRGGETPVWTTKTYDVLDRPKDVVAPGGATSHWDYSLNWTGATDADGHNRQNWQDAAGRLFLVREVRSGSELYDTSYVYDVLDNLKTVTQGQQTRTFNYDGASRLRSAINPESGTVTYTYYDTGTLHTRTDARPVTLTQTFDVLNRLVSKTYSDGTLPVTYMYDDASVPFGKGRLASYYSGTYPASPWSMRIDAYDAMGHAKQSTQRIDGTPYLFKYTYNAAGDLLSETYPSTRIVNTSYDIINRPVGVDEGPALQHASQIQYAAHGAMSAIRFGNGLWGTTTFTPRLEPWIMGLGTQPTTRDVWQIENGYWPNGNVKQQTLTTAGNSFTSNYHYDGLNRIDSVSESTTVPGASSWAQTYDYDRWGNRALTSGSMVDSTIAPINLASFDSATNRLSSALSVNYDNAGNLKGTTAGTYTYDGENRQVSANGSTYTYDGEGQRIKKTVAGATTKFLYDAMGRLAAEYANTTPIGLRYFAKDPLGSTRLVTDGGGVVKSRHDYMPFGEEIPFSTTAYGGRGTIAGYNLDPNVHLKFTGKERDGESGLDYFRVRYSSSATGRFMSPDPLLIMKQRIVDPQQWHMYAYVRNNPLKFTDPSGMYVAMCGAEVAGCSKEIDSFDTNRQKVDKAKSGLVRRAAASYGAKGAKNGVLLMITKTPDPRHPNVPGATGRTDGTPGYTIDPTTATIQNATTIKIKPGLSGTELQQIIVHEGWHNVDRESVVNMMDIAETDGGGHGIVVGPTIGQVDSANITGRTSERNAYGVQNEFLGEHGLPTIDIEAVLARPPYSDSSDIDSRLFPELSF